MVGSDAHRALEVRPEVERGYDWRHGGDVGAVRARRGLAEGALQRSVEECVLSGCVVTFQSGVHSNASLRTGWEHSLSLSNVRVESGVRGTLSSDNFLCGGKGTCCSWMGESCLGSACPLRTASDPDGSLSASELSDAYVESAASLTEFVFECESELRPSDDGRCACAPGPDSRSDGEDADRFIGCAPHPGVVGVVRTMLRPLTDFVGLSCPPSCSPGRWGFQNTCGGAGGG